MQVIILAAGKGTRLGKMTETTPKPLIPVNGIPVLIQNIKSLYLAGARKTIIVVGYKHHDITETLGSHYKEMKIDYVFNERFNSTNNIYSLWKCNKQLITDDSIILDGDVLFNPTLISNIIHSEINNLIGVSQMSSFMNGTSITVGKNGLMSISKKTFRSTNQDQFKTINIYKFSKNFSKSIYVPKLEKRINENKTSGYYEDILSSHIINKYFKLYRVTSNEKWVEIDTPADLMIASVIFNENKERYKEILSSYGGFWRIPGLLDFHYLTNPFFPPEQLLNEIKNSIGDLIINYPSGRHIEDLLASVVFECPKETVTVSNGASELIKSIIAVLNCKIGLFLPTFEEYANNVEKDKLNVIETESSNFRITYAQLKNLADQSDCVILINPNNPTGLKLSRKILLQYLEYLLSRGKYLIVDESFADFAEENTSLATQNIIAKYNNLFIIKSMGKSHGIPGLRLGVLFSSNIDITDGVRQALPIWNINSIAEYYLEIFPRYRNIFKTSRLSVQKERSFLELQLSKCKNLKVYKSQANFIFCRINNDISADELSYRLFSEYNILIKDCSKKTGLNNNQYIRIAVKSRQENTLLLRSLRKLL